MNLWHLVFRTDSLTYTIGRALSELGHEVSIWVVDPDYGSRPEDHTQKRLADMQAVRIVRRDRAKLPAGIDRLIVQAFPRPAEALRDLPLLAAGARAITLISSGDRSRRWRDAMRLQWLELRTLGPHARRVDRVLYKDGFHGADLHGAFRSRCTVGFDVHSHFLYRADQFDAMHAQDWDARTQRPFLANFLGSQDPSPRKAILDAVRHLFVASSGEARIVRPGKSMFWHEYSDAKPAGLAPTEFVNMLTRSDFTLCPRGYSLVTHRPLEALLRGSIPVLGAHELDLYGIELVDGRNCIAVADDGWLAAIERITRLPESAIVTMRENVLAMRPALAYRQVARGICARLGVEGESARAASGASATPVHSRQ